jgi:hypothetical protein
MASEDSCMIRTDLMVYHDDDDDEFTNANSFSYYAVFP